MLPLVCKKFDFKVGDYILIENIKALIAADDPVITATHISGGKASKIYLTIGSLTPEEKKIILSGCLINYNKK